jgi:hypothetical protein
MRGIMTNKGSKFERKDKDMPSKKKVSWYEGNRCDFRQNDKRCRMLGTSGERERKYCAFHVDVLRAGDEGRRQLDTKKGFESWMKAWAEHRDIHEDQFSNKPFDRLWEMVGCESLFRI